MSNSQLVIFNSHTLILNSPCSKVLHMNFILETTYVPHMHFTKQLSQKPSHLWNTCVTYIGLPWYQRFSLAHEKWRELRKTYEEIVTKSCWACAISHPGVWTSRTGQTAGCVTGFSPLHQYHSRTWTVCLTADQNGARLNEMAREEIELKPHSKVILCQVQLQFQRFSFVEGGTSL